MQLALGPPEESVDGTGLQLRGRGDFHAVRKGTGIASPHRASFEQAVRIAVQDVLAAGVGAIIVGIDSPRWASADGG
jgi:hypothetical protein